MRRFWIDLWHYIGAGLVRIRSGNGVRIGIAGGQLRFWIFHYYLFPPVRLEHLFPFEHGVFIGTGLIVAANRVEHYEIAAYGSARTFAQTLGLTGAATLLAQTLQEEKMADQKLTEIAEGMVNNEALRAGSMQLR